MTNLEKWNLLSDLEDLSEWTDSQDIDLSNSKKVIDLIDGDERERATENINSINTQKNKLSDAKLQCEELGLDMPNLDDLLKRLNKFEQNIQLSIDENNLEKLSKVNEDYEADKWLIDIEINKILEVIQENVSKVSEVLDSAEVPDQEVDSVETDSDTNEEESNRWKDNFGTSWVVMYWSPVIPDFADVVSNKPAALGVFNLTHKKSWLTLTTVWLTDFDFSKSNESNPLSTVFVANPNYSKSWEFKSGNSAQLTVNSKINVAPKIRDENDNPYISYTPDIIWSYTAKGWTVEWMYSHDFKENNDVIRASVSKTIENLQFTLQAWYDKAYAKTHKAPGYLRLLANVDLWDLDLWLWKNNNDKLWLQVSLIVKNGKVVPTGSLLLKF